MSNRISIFALFSVLSAVLVFGIWGNIQAHAQQPSSSITPLSPPAISRSTTISPQVKAVMCAPNSPSLKVVNTTEARICGIPKTVKTNTTTAAAIPSISPTAVSSLPTTTKLAAANIGAPKQQKITTTPVASQLPKQTTEASKETTTTAVSNKPSLPSSPSTIAPQVNAISKKPQQQELLQPATNNLPSGRNFTFATTTPAVTSDTLKYLGYKGRASAADSGSSSDSKDKHSSDTKSTSSSSIILNDISSVIKKSFNYKHSRHSDSSNVASYFSSFNDNFPFTVSASSSAIAGGASAAASASAGGG
jgi:hypothetical protein